MSVIIKGIDAYNCCYECPFHSTIYNGSRVQRWCEILNKVAADYEEHSPDDCPITQLVDE